MTHVSRIFLVGAAVLAAWPVGTARAQQQQTATPQALHVLGLETLKANAKGRLSVAGGALRFVAGAGQADVPIAAIQDIFTGDDSKRVVGGALGTMTMFAPYGGGRFLSLFREKIDVLTVEYRDMNGALHGAVFTLPKGEAAKVKTQLVAQGAHASIPVEEAKPEKGPQEKKP